MGTEEVKRALKKSRSAHIKFTEQQKIKKNREKTYLESTNEGKGCKVKQQ